MASQVPYQPVPDVEPGGAPLQRMQIQTPPDAFGAATAAATQHLGEVSSQAGDELYDRAIALQQFDQQSKANDAISDFTTQLGQKFSAFTSLQGKAASDGYQPFLQDVTNTRDQMRGNLQSPYAQRAFDQESRFLQARMAMSGALHAGEQLKAYGIQTSKSRMEANNNLSAVDPTNNDQFAATLAGNATENHQLAVTQSWDPTTEALNLQKANSNSWVSRLTAMAPTQPYAAGKLLQQAHQSGALIGDDFSKMTEMVQKQQNTVGARNIAHNALTGQDLSWGDKPVAPEVARAAITGNEADKRGYGSIGPETTNKEGVSGKALGAYQIMDYNLSPWLKAAGMPPMTSAQFVADPAAQDKLFDSKFGAYQQQYGSWNAAAQAWFGGEGSVGKANITDGYHTGAWYLTNGNATIAKMASRTDLDDYARAQSSKLAPDNPDLPDYASHYIELEKSRQLQDQQADEFTTRQTLTNAMIKGQGQDGKLPTSIEQITQDPQVKMAWNTATPEDQQKILKQLSQNAKGDYTATPQNQSQYRTILGQLTDPQMSEDDRDKALSTDIGNLPMPASQRQQLLSAQGRLFQRATQNPDVSRALNQVQDITNGVLDKKNDPDDYYKFYGAFQETIQDQMEQTKAPLKADQVRSIAQGLIKQIYPGGWFGSPTYQYQMPVPDDFKSRALGVARANGQPDPTDAQVYDAYQALQYRAVAGGKTPNGRPQ